MKKLKEGEKYWYIRSYMFWKLSFEAVSTIYMEEDLDDRFNIANGNCFPTKREALQAILRMKEALKQR